MQRLNRRRQPTPPLIPWPTSDQLRAAGFVRCTHDGCTTHLDPANVTSQRCQAHRQPSKPARDAH